jgi:putative addiction module killer protein
LDYSLQPLRQTARFALWLANLTDRRARSLVQNRINRLRLGLPGDARAVGSGVVELRIHHGPGYRIYWCRAPDGSPVLLAGGTKRSQVRDIPAALRLARQL